MDRKSFLVLIICFIVLMAWYPLLNRIYPPKKAPVNTNTVVEVTGQTNRTNGLNLTTNLEPTVLTSTPATNRSPVLPAPTAPEQLLTLQNDQARYTFTTYGGGIKSIELKKYLEAVGSQRRKNPSDTNLATLNAQSSMPILAILDGEVVQGDGVYSLTETGGCVRAEKQLTNGLRLIKEFRLSTNYLVDATVRLENVSNQPLTLPAQEWAIGTATPLGPFDNNTLLMGVMAYNGDAMEDIGDAWFANRSLGCIPGTPRTLFASKTNIVWGAVHNQFFAVAVIPLQPAPQLLGRKIDLPPPSPLELAAHPGMVAKPIGFEATLVYPGLTLAPQQKLEKRFFIYVGPKEYNTLARIGVAFNNNLDLIMGFGGFFGFFAKILLLSMNGIHALGLGYGLAIIVITVLIKLLFWPLTNASTKSMKRMAALQPQMKALQEKYKDDPRKMNLKLMEFMKEHKVSPVSGCFPMLLQIPVFFGFYRMLQSAIELRGAHFLWASDLSTSDTVWMIPGLNFPVNPLPLIMGVTMVWQARMTPPSPGMDPVQQKIMKYMPLMFMVFLYNFSAGLTLYWTVQNLLTIAQMKLTRNVNTTVEVVKKPVTPTPGAFGSRRPKP